MNNADMPAMALVEPAQLCTVNEGLSKREHLAAMAMQACRADCYQNWQDLSEDAVKMADALLAELAKESE